MAERGSKVELFETFEASDFRQGDTGSEYVTCKAFRNPLIGVILVDFHMGLGLYRWQYISFGISKHRNRGFFMHDNTEDAIRSAITYFHVLTGGQFRSYKIWWRH